MEVKNKTEIGKGWGSDVKIIRRPPFWKVVQDSEVLETINYENFSCDKKNRPVSEEKIHFFMKQFKQGKFFMKEFPVIADKQFVILDGQHRYEAVKRMELPLYFRFADTLSLESVIDVQINAGWTTKDYLHAFIQQNNMNYIILNRFISRYKLSMSVAVMLLSGDNSGGLKRTGFYEGTFKVKNEERAHEQAKAINEIGEMALNLHRDRCFCIAMIKVMEHPEFEEKRLTEQITKYRSLVLRQVSVEGYIRNMEEVYNYHLYTKNKVRFI